MLEYNITEPSFNNIIFENVKCSFSESMYNIDRTELTSSKFLNFKVGQTKESDMIKEEFFKLNNCDYFILVFPYSITGVPSLVKEWLDQVLFNNDLSQSKNRKGLIITYTSYPRESFKPNSFHRSTLKRRLHYLLYGALKAKSIQPLEPIVLYNFSNSLLANLSSAAPSKTVNTPTLTENRSEIAGLSRVLTSKFANAENFENESNNSNVNINSLRSHSVKSRKEKSIKGSQDREDFLNELTSSLMSIEEANEIEIIEL